MSTSHDAADFVRSWLREHSARFTHDEVETLITELKAAIGRELTRDEVNEVVEALASPPQENREAA